MQVQVNDQRRELPEGATVADLLAVLALPGTRVAVELNRALVRRQDHATTTLREGDRLEVVTLVGGGAPPLQTMQTQGRNRVSGCRWVQAS